MWMGILLADDQPEVRRALAALLQRQPGVKVVGEAVDAADLLAQVKTVNPGTVLLDWELPGNSHAGLMSALRGARPDLVVIALSGRPEARQDALLAGVDAFVSKADPPEKLLRTIELVGANGDCSNSGMS
jgi:DNA-binding NarL/FixJ family response regulator